MKKKPEETSTSHPAMDASVVGTQVVLTALSMAMSVAPPQPQLDETERPGLEPKYLIEAELERRQKIPEIGGLLLDAAEAIREAIERREQMQTRILGVDEESRGRRRRRLDKGESPEKTTDFESGARKRKRRITM